MCPPPQIGPKGKRTKWPDRQRKKSSSREKKETSIPLQKDSESQSKKQTHSNELSENSSKGDVRLGERPEKEGRLVELVVIGTQVLKHLPGAR